MAVLTWPYLNLQKYLKEKIDVYNYGNMYRDFTYVDDTVDRVFKIFKKGLNLKK